MLYVYYSSPTQEMVLKVTSINCNRCKAEILTAVTKLLGIDKISVDMEQGTLFVSGEVDPAQVANQVRKIGKVAEIISVGPLKAAETPRQETEKKVETPEEPDELPFPLKEPDHPNSFPRCCRECEFDAVVYETCDNGRFCSIL
uniref:HMA domain-containing protein n=1 Tax=Nelumbo nucifera TaxID=4432 RepID=A0A822Y5P7_NELNU|nr:TPA_asm: hypothetical protein HUJ06_026392 [Nelumbo nucifera]